MNGGPGVATRNLVHGLRVAVRATGLPRLVMGALPRKATDWYNLRRLARLREEHARPYLAGAGLEIGAMHFPLRVAPGVTVRYVDYLTREENLRRFPYLDARKLVTPDYIDDGFRLTTIAPASQDFLVANHVLEHSPDPIGTLEVWWNVLRPGGVLYVTVPLAAHCFDRGREITPLHHLVDDHLAAADAGALVTRNRSHYEEWIGISLKNWAADEGRPWEYADPVAATRYVEQMMAERAEIHFHTFSHESFRALLQHFCARRGTASDLIKVEDLGAEVLGVLRKRPGGAN